MRNDQFRWLIFIILTCFFAIRSELVDSGFEVITNLIGCSASILLTVILFRDKEKK